MSRRQPTELKRLDHDWVGGEQQVWQRDNPYTTVDGNRAFLDRQTGELLWMFAPEVTGADETAADVLSRPDSVEIPPLTHSEHHEIFARFIATLPADAREACNTASIGGFRETSVAFLTGRGEDDPWRLWHEWQAFHDDELQALASAWYREHGFAVRWR